jgi:hypothetical protein
LTSDRTLKFKGEKCVGGKLSSDRITVLFCANAEGIEKRKFLVIGKSKNPKCFKNVKSLPLCYGANKEAWMTSDFLKSRSSVRATLVYSDTNYSVPFMTS